MLDTPEGKGGVDDHKFANQKYKRCTYDPAPVRRLTEHKMYKLKSVVTMLKRMSTVARIIPHFSNSSGIDRIPPPTIVATRANVAETRVAWRVGQ